MEWKNVEGHNGLIKNEDGVVLNTNSTEIEAARARKKAWKDTPSISRP